MNLISSTGSYPPRPLPLEEKFQIAIQILLDGAKFLFIYNFIRKKKRINFQRGLLAGGQYFHNQWRFRHFTISRGGQGFASHLIIYKVFFRSAGACGVCLCLCLCRFVSSFRLCSPKRSHSHLLLLLLPLRSLPLLTLRSSRFLSDL